MFEAHLGSVNSLCFSPDSRLLASGGNDHIVQVSDLAEEELVFSSTAHTKPVYCVAFSSNGKMLASGSRDKSVLIFDTTSCLLMCYPLIQ